MSKKGMDISTILRFKMNASKRLVVITGGYKNEKRLY